MSEAAGAVSGRGCTTCKETLPITAFGKRSSSSDGLQRQCRSCGSEAQKAYRARHPGRAQESIRKWTVANREKRREIDRLKSARRRLRPEVRLNNRISCAVWRGLKDRKAGRTWAELVGYELRELTQHIERQFLKGMSWENMGEWHIDHITPLSSFSFTEAHDADFKRAWALPNLRPLWAVDNVEKSDKRTCLV